MDQSLEEDQNVKEKVEVEQKNKQNDNKESTQISPETSSKSGKSQIPFETFQTFLRPHFEDMSVESYQKIIIPPIFNTEEINTNLFKLKCDNLTDMDINLDELLVNAILSDEEETFELENLRVHDIKQETLQSISDKNILPIDYMDKDIDASDVSEEKEEESNIDEESNEKITDIDEDIAQNFSDILDDQTITHDKEQQETEYITKYENDILANRNINENRIPVTFFEEYKEFIDQIELKNLNIDQCPIVDLLKQQIEINNSRREKTRKILNIKIKHIAILKTLRDIDKKIEKHVFKRIKQKKKKKGDENPDFILKLIGERNIFTQIYKQEMENAFNVLEIKENIFENDNVDIAHLGLDNLNMFP